MQLLIDDIVCFSASSAEHVRDLLMFFERLIAFDVKLAPEKAHLEAKLINNWGIT